MNTYPTIADIFRRFGPDYRKRYGGLMPYSHLRVMWAIEACRTSALGGHLYQCDHCDAKHYVFHSCRNRHCPTCQFLSTERWVEARKTDLLPIPYFHIVFTLPHELHDLVRGNQRICYRLLFRAVSQTLLDLGEDPRHLGAKIGFIAVLHTWSQTLAYHPHLHCIVTGGGLSDNCKRWKSSREDFFLPVRVMSRLFRGKFLHALQNTDGLPSTDPGILSSLYRKDWVVYCKPPFAGPRHVLAYLGRYTHRVAISNARIISCDEHRVVFRYRDPHAPKTSRSLSLHPIEFLRRFLTHVLPPGFVKIRYFGLLANRSRKVLMAHCRRILLVLPPPEPPEKTWQQLVFDRTGVNPARCAVCNQGTLMLKAILAPTDRSPPQSFLKTA